MVKNIQYLAALYKDFHQLHKLMIFLFFVLLFIPISKSSAQTIEGDYKVGDTKCSIKMDVDYVFRVYWEDIDNPSLLKYKENMVTGEQVWVEKRKGNVVGNFILQNDYLSGRYVRFSDDAKIDVVKIQ